MALKAIPGVFEKLLEFLIIFSLKKPLRSFPFFIARAFGQHGLMSRVRYVDSYRLRLEGSVLTFAIGAR
jgi:hypothetical protein